MANASLAEGRPHLAAWTSVRSFALLRDASQLGVEIFRLEQREKAPAGSRQRKGDPVQAELDSAERIDHRTAHLRPFGAGDECRHLGSLRPAAGRRHRSTPPPASTPRGKASGTEARDQALLASTWRHRPAGLPQGLRLRVWQSGLPASGCSADAREQSALAPSLPPPWRQKDSCPEPHVGHRWRSAFTVDDGWGWIFTAVEHWNADMLQARRPLRRPAAISMGLAGLWLDRGRRGSGAGLDGSSSVGPLHQPDQVLGHRRLRSAEDQRRSIEQHARCPWSHYRNIAELRDAVRDFVELYNAQWIVEKNGYLSPAQARPWHAAISIRPAA